MNVISSERTDGLRGGASVRAVRVCFAGVALVLSACSVGLSAQDVASPRIFSKATASRAAELLGRMTTEEKIGQMTQLFVFKQDDAVDAMIRTGKMGSALFVTDPVEINRLQHLAVDNTRLHIPLIFGFDVIHGFKTIFPVPIAMAASWDPAGAEREETVAAAEARSVGIHWAFAPMLDIARDARWGRMVEGAGEDPYLGAAMARAEVRGFQGAAIGTPDHVLACAKHFAGYGAAVGGRDYDESYISDAQMQNVYLPPFRAAVEAGVGSLMSAYMDLNDVPATGNRFLLTETLRDSWHFQGYVVSDADAVKSLVKHGFANDAADAALRAMTAGVNMEMALKEPAYAGLQQALAEKKITVRQIDALVLPILEAKVQLGLFEHPFVDVARSKTVLADPAHRVEARLAAERSAVLLRNEGGLLPLAKTAYKTVAVIGPMGEEPTDMTGPWAFQQDNAETVMLVGGLKAKLGAGVMVSYAPGVQISRPTPSIFDDLFHIPRAPQWGAGEAKAQFEKAVALARGADVVVMTLGERALMSGEQASQSSLEFPGEQQKLLEAVMAVGKPTVLVLQNGRPLNLIWAKEHVPAILEIWHPGSQGGAAAANLLFGDAVPGGHLPFAWPRNAGQIPINYAHNLTQDAEKEADRYWDEPSTPLFPFGYGLSYSTFAYSNLKVDRANSRVGEEVAVTVDVENTGAVAADTVAQLYVHQQAGRASRPVRELKGFERVRLEAKGKTTVRFSLGPKELRYWSASDRAWGEDAATFDLWAGEDATASLHGVLVRGSGR